jgi:hypothetical protein
MWATGSVYRPFRTRRFWGLELALRLQRGCCPAPIVVPPTWVRCSRALKQSPLSLWPLQVSLKAAVLPRLSLGATEQLSMGGIWNGGLNHPGRGGHVVVAELLITLSLVGGWVGWVLGGR